MPTLDVVRRISIEAHEKGLSDVTGKLQKLEAQYEGIAQAGVTVDKSTQSVERALAREVRALDQTTTAYNAFARSAKSLADARAQGLISEGRHAELLGLAEQRLRKTAEASHAYAKGTEAATNQSKLARHELINLGRQVQDVGVSLASGQSALTVAFQQGSQIFDVFASSSVKFSDAIKGVGSSILGFFTPARVGIVAVTAALLEGVTALNRYDDAQRKVLVSLSGLGRGSGVSRGDVNALAEATAGPAKLTTADTREVMSSFVSTGRIGADVMRELTLATKDFAATTSQDVPDAAKEMARIFGGDLVQSIEELQKKFGGFIAAQMDAVRSFDAVGNRAAAQKVMLDGLRSRLANATETTSFWKREVELFLKPIKELDEVLGKYTARLAGLAPPPTAAENLAKVREEMQRLREEAELASSEAPPKPRGIFGVQTRGGTGEMLGPHAREQDFEGPIRAAEAALAAEKQLTAEKEKQARISEASIRMRGSTESMFPELAQFENLRKVITDYNFLLAESKLNPALVPELENARVAAEAAAMQLAQMAVNGDKLDAVGTRVAAIARDFNLQAQAIRAVTVEQKAAAAAALAHQNALKSGDVIAAAEAEKAYALVKAQSTKAIEDSIRASEDQRALMRAEVDSLGMSKAAREVYLAGIEAEIKMKRDLGNIQEPVAQAYIQEAKNREAQNQQLIRQKAVLADNIRAWQQYAQEFAAVMQQLVSEGRSATLDISGRLPQAPNSPFTGGSVERMVQGSLGKPLDLGTLAVRDPVQEAIAAQYGGKGTWETRTGAGASIGIRTNVSTQFIPNAEGYAYKAEQAAAAAKEAQTTATATAGDDPTISRLQRQLGLLRNPIGEPFTGPLESAIESLKSKLGSASNDNVAANASKTDPRLDPYMSRNASIYYGTETDTFYEEMTWQEAQASRLGELGDTADSQLGVMTSQLAMLENVYASIREQTDGLDTLGQDMALALSNEVAAALNQLGMTGEASQVSREAQIRALEAQIAETKATSRTGSGTTAAVVPLVGQISSINLSPNASGLDTMLPGSGGERPYIFSAQPGERLRITPRGRGGETIINQVIHVHGVQSPERVPSTVRGLISSATQTAQTRTSLRGAA